MCYSSNSISTNPPLLVSLLLLSIILLLTPTIGGKDDKISESTEKPVNQCSVPPMCFNTAHKSLPTSTPVAHVDDNPPDTTKTTSKKQVALKTQINASDCEAFRSLVEQHDWPVEDALKICQCESGGNKNAVGYGRNYGLMQINALPNRLPPSELIKPATNITVAYQIWEGQGKRFGTTGGWLNCGKKMGVY